MTLIYVTFLDSSSPTKSQLIDLADIRTQVTEIKARMDKYGKWQAVLGLPPTCGTTTINDVADKLDKTQSLWETVDKWQKLVDSYNTMPFTSLNKADISRDIEGVVAKAATLLANDTKNVVALTLMERVDQYKRISFLFDFSTNISLMVVDPSFDLGTGQCIHKASPLEQVV